jgi:archaeal chaperonin
VFIEGCKNPKAVTILVRAGSQRVVDEAERSIHDAIMATKDVIEYPYVVACGGAPEAFAARHVRDWANSLSGRTQLAAQKFADSLEELPLTRRKNAGMDPLLLKLSSVPRLIAQVFAMASPCATKST